MSTAAAISLAPYFSLSDISLGVDGEAMLSTHASVLVIVLASGRFKMPDDCGE